MRRECSTQLVANIWDELKRLSVIANALNRSLVLPPLHCHSGKWQYCNLCTFDSTLNCFESIINNFTQPVKESVFFINTKVPRTIVNESRHNPILRFGKHCTNNTTYKSDFPANRENRNPLLCIPCSGSSDWCIIKEGKKHNDWVLKIHSLL